MGYTSRYDETVKVDLSDGYWVLVKRCLSGAQMAQCRNNLVTYRVLTQPDERGIVNYAAVIDRVDPTGFAREVALASLVEWNIDGDDGEVLPLSCGGDNCPGLPLCGACYTRRRDNYGLLTEADQDAIEKVVVPANLPPTRQEEESFPAKGKRRPPAGKVTSPHGGEVAP